ncbi:retinol dehydrogenase [Reticulibacter mediterranei]|uniref:Retinol dehydrogenase n=1 Tax=Reticulibacter mediterranei TaxID=2778369 RepID=A0A8J3N5M7_9CHLR|nr:SDR family oxidoreductase [Reticulibacter mediterranei]GHO99249.1 retinol dehydrogenase [Reticulibacter mediterranei]
MMQNKIALVTGANTGIGKVITTELAHKGATVVLVSRDRHRGEEAMREIAATTGNSSLDLLVADLSSQQAVRDIAEQFQQRYSQLHILVNNAGAHVQQRQMSIDGIEMNLAINHLASFLLTNLLLDTMRKSTPVRVVNVLSDAMTRVNSLEDLQSEQAFVPFEVYGKAKLMQLMCGYVLARKLTGTGITVNALHPGITATKIINDVAPPPMRPIIGIFKLFMQSPKKGASTALYLATSPEVEGITGQYFIKSKPERSVPISYDKELQQRIWDVSAQLVGLDHLVEHHA